MVLTRESPARLEFARETSFRAPVLTALGFAVLALLPLLGPGPVTLGRSLLAASLALAASALIAYSWPRRQGLRIALDAGLVELDERSLPLTRARVLALTTGGSTRNAAARTRYRVELVLDDDERILLLERSDPALVLGDLRAVLRQFPLPVRSGWGLEADAEPWRERARAHAPPAARVQARTRPFEGELGAGVCVISGAVVIGGAMTIMHAARIARGAPTAPLSYFLSSALLLLVVCLGVFLLSDGVEARVEADELVVERRAVGLRLDQKRTPIASLRGVYAVGMIPGMPLHLVLDSDEALSAVPFTGEAATTVVRAFGEQA